MPLVINVIGVGRKSGKTTLIERLTKELTDKSYKVWTVKNISTAFDTTEKDTWRHLDAGASAVVAVTENELVTIRRTPEPSLDRALEALPEEVGLVLVEGFRKSRYPKIVAARTAEDAAASAARVEGVIAVAGPFAEGEGWKVPEGVPVLGFEELASKVEGMLLDYAVRRLPGIDCRSCGYASCEALAEALLKGEASLDRCKPLSEEEVVLTADGERIFLASFPKNFVKNTVLGMMGSLKGVKKEGLKRISLEISLE